MIVTLSQEEDKRTEELMVLKKKYEVALEQITKELRIMIYKLDRKP